MTGKLDRLERQGLIQRTPDPEDRRAIRLGLTEDGRTLINEAFARAGRRSGMRSELTVGGYKFLVVAGAGFEPATFGL